jgi:creatinine amidohydrolase
VNPSTLVQAELLLPHEIDAALAANSVVYLPLGSIEYHGRHLPIGLDGLNAHGICIRAAQERGGIVLPTLYYGTGGGHTAYPWTIMATTQQPLVELLETSLTRLAQFGVRIAVLFTGHFAAEQLAMIDDLAGRWNDSASTLNVLPLSVSQTSAVLAPDHAGVFETTLVAALWPDRVQLDQLPSVTDAPAADPPGSVGYGHRHDPEHPLWGVMGLDPRGSDLAKATSLLEHVVTWTNDQVEQFRNR